MSDGQNAGEVAAGLPLRAWAGALDTWRRFRNRRLVYPLALLARREFSTYRHLEALRATQWDQPEVIRRRQFQRLSELVAWARQRSPYYSGVLADWKPPSGHDPQSLLRTLPILERASLQDSFDGLATRLDERTVRKTTGGSTGEAVHVLKNADAVARERAASWLAHGWFGIQIGDPVIRMWGAGTTTKRRVRSFAADFAMGRRTMSAFSFDDEDLATYWQRCREFRPHYLYGYVSMIATFADFLRRGGYPAHELPLKAVVTTAEVLTAGQRRSIESTFRAPIQNEYGCGEVGPIAYECPEGSLHVMAENVVVEVVDAAGQPAGPGRPGQVLVTDLNNRAMPLLRYRIGDNATAGGTCVCGRGSPVLDRVWGRAYDFVQDPQGRRYHGEYFMYLFEDLRDAGVDVRQFRVTQLDARTLRIDVVPSASHRFCPQIIRDAVAGRLPGMAVHVRQVEEVAREASGKLRIIRNETP